MMQQSELIQSVVTEVLRQMQSAANSQAAPATNSRPSANQGSAPAPASQANPAEGTFADVDTAVASAEKAQQQLAAAGVKTRDAIVKLIKKIAGENAKAWGEFELNETQVGRLDHKIAKLELLENVPGVEFLTTPAHSGDDGVSLDEGAPWGVIGVITPVTHSIPTMTANAINMIAAGNSMVINAHPSGAKSAILAARTYNRAIKQQFNIDPLLCIMDPPTLRSAEKIFSHPRIPLLVATGGPAVAKAAAKQPKRAIVAGPGNPPVVIDASADLDNAAKSIIAGAAFDNNLLCIGEKEVFVVREVFEAMMQAMVNAGAVQLTTQQINKLTETAMTFHDDHWVPRKEFVGADASRLAEAAGITVPAGTDLLFGETAADHPFVPTEQMMPFVPFVRCSHFDHALQLAVENEHGFGHTAIIHSNNLANISRMGRVMNTTLFVVNGPCTAGLGAGGEGYASYSIATPSGEGITSPATFTRFRRMSVSGSLRMI
ncbi:aldehyde dehydrogenase [Mucisphaera calidilacus]|uniref:Succinate-semialdehyde dehydrogenase (Acetylating) n=1 Tax=Mucisphaera calidilacus TaxID=2527982 RepID=A0A518BYG8_9BACT|nr:aldehyde dehydrogenase [Mucisphaera calidilacus]QDU72012.1 Succinate-semialdehyde dehydrogenase (acetylating) [Mucisphaera calidilacus]